MWQLGGFAKRSPTLDRRPDRSPGAAAQGPEMSPEMPVARLCALPEPRPPRASRSPKRAEVRHPAVDVTEARPGNAKVRAYKRESSPRLRSTSRCVIRSVKEWVFLAGLWIQDP